jgi:hypothetical protein
MTTLSLKPKNAAISVALWRVALLAIYAVMLFQFSLLAKAIVKGNAITGQTSHTRSVSTQRLGRNWRTFSTVTAAMVQKLGSKEALTASSYLMVIGYLAVYLHLKLTVSAGERNRLSKLKGRIDPEPSVENDRVAHLPSHYIQQLGENFIDGSQEGNVELDSLSCFSLNLPRVLQTDPGINKACALKD